MDPGLCWDNKGEVRKVIRDDVSDCLHAPPMHRPARTPANVVSGGNGLKCIDDDSTIEAPEVEGACSRGQPTKLTPAAPPDQCKVRHSGRPTRPGTRDMGSGTLVISTRETKRSWREIIAIQLLAVH